MRSSKDTPVSTLHVRTDAISPPQDVIRCKTPKSGAHTLACHEIVCTQKAEHPARHERCPKKQNEL